MDDLEQRAQRLAAHYHQGQSYGEKPYTAHLADVVAVLKRFGVTNPVLLAAGWLHDAIEDTSVTFEQLEAEFGQDVANLVAAVTSESGSNRKERNAKTYLKIRENPDAVVLKLCDRIANVEASLQTHPPKLKMYRSEFPTFQAALKQEGAGQKLWEHLEELVKL